MKQPKPNNVFTIINGKCHGNFHPAFRADMERRAAAEGLTFDQYMVRDFRNMLHSVLAVI